jgi:hypothetical protein
VATAALRAVAAQGSLKALARTPTLALICKARQPVQNA